MLVRLNSNVVINTKYITAIKPVEGNMVNSSGNPVKYTLYMVDGRQWNLTEEDNCEISHQI